MEITIEQYNKIQDYLDGAMTEAQKKEFLLELNTDTGLRDFYEFELNLRKNIQSTQETREMIELSNQNVETSNDFENAGFIRNIIEKAGKEWKDENKPVIFSDENTITDNTEPGKIKKTKIRSIRSWGYVAAAACLLVAIIGIVFITGKNNNQGNGNAGLAGLFDLFFKKDTVPKESPPVLAQAFSDYEKNYYPTIQNYDLLNLPNLKGVDYGKQKVLELGYYYKGISYLETGEFEKAKNCFQWVVDSSKTEELVWKAQWYDALAFIKTSNKEKAAELLQSVASNAQATGYNKQAEELLQKLQKK